MPRQKKDDLIIHALEPSNLSRFNKKDGIWSQRFPTSYWEILDAVEGGGRGAKNPNPSQTFGNAFSGGLVDPYKFFQKARFEDTFRSDSTAQKAVRLLVQFILSKELQTVTDARKYYATEQLRKQAVESILSNQEYQQVLVKVKEVDRAVKLQDRLTSSHIQKYVFGRAVLGIVKGKDNLPTDLRQLASKNLGRVHIDKNWRLEGVDYTDNIIGTKTGLNNIRADKMLYFTNMDYNITPNTIFYGQSLLEGIVDASTWKRIILQEDGPETAKGLWAGTGIIKAPSITSSSKLQTLINGMDPGKWNVINSDVTLEVHKIADKILELTQVIEQLDRQIIRGIGVPSPLMGYEDVTNRATMNEVMAVWKETTLEFERVGLQSQLNNQWYDTLLGLITGIKPEELDYKIGLEYQDLIFETVKDKADALNAIMSAGVPMTDEAKLEFLGLDNLIEDLPTIEAEMQEKEQLMQQQQPQQQRQEQEEG